MTTTLVGYTTRGNRLENIRRRCRTLLLYAVGFTLMSGWSILILAVAILTLFQARRLYAEMARTLARVGLWMGGIRVNVHYAEPLPTGQAIYICNHGSTLDVILLVALGLPNARFFLGGHLRKKLPLGLIGYLIGVFWTVPQRFPERRVKIFQRAERVLRRTGESVFLSPEGNQGNTGMIAPFNKGAFHLATNLHVPIVPFFVYIPSEMDPGWGYEYRPGVVEVHFSPAIRTDDWTLADLDKNREQVRAHFLELNQHFHGNRT
jgi:1-acyl-sn-glycerol-3-phosphate acyltransferase